MRRALSSMVSIVAFTDVVGEVSAPRTCAEWAARSHELVAAARHARVPGCGRTRSERCLISTFGDGGFATG